MAYIFRTDANRILKKNYLEISYILFNFSERAWGNFSFCLKDISHFLYIKGNLLMYVYEKF